MDKLHEIAGDGALMPRFDDGMVNMAESTVNEITDVRGDEACESGNRRNGYRERELVTSAGTIDLRIPKPRAGSHFPEDLIERSSRVDRAVIATVSEMATSGVSTRKVKRVARTMGIDRMSASKVSRICSSLNESVADLWERDLPDVVYPHIWLDATYIKSREWAAAGSATTRSAGPSRALRSTSPRTPTRAPQLSTRPGSSRSRWPTTRFPAVRRRSMR